MTLNQNVVVAEGGDVSLPCQAAPGSNLVSARWQVGNKHALQMPLSNLPGMGHQIPEVTREDDGEWTCFVKSGDFSEDSVVHRLTVVSDLPSSAISSPLPITLASSWTHHP